MKLKRKRLTKQDYDKMIKCAIRLLEADWLCNEILAEYYKRRILKIVGIRDKSVNLVSPYHPLPEPRWIESGFKQCCDLMFLYKWAHNDDGFSTKSDLDHLCRKFVEWLYAECERDPSKDREDDQKGEAK